MTHILTIGLVVGFHAVGQDAGTTFVAELDGRQTIPPAATTATGNCTGTLSDDESEFVFSCTHDAAFAVQGHIHRGAVGISGDIVFEFAEDDCCPESTTWFLTAEEVADLQAGDLYVNIHSETFASEEIRGQFLASVGQSGGDGDDDVVQAPQEFEGLCGAFLAQMLLVPMLLLLCLRTGTRRLFRL